MASPKQMDRQDVMYIGGETSEIYQHTAGVMILDPSTSKGFSFAKLKKRLAERLDQVPQFRWRLHQVPMGLDLPYWVDDEDFSYDHHIKRIAAPSPGDREALAEVVGHLYAQHLDRNRPLWEIWMIEGLEDGKCAVMQKIHHCLMDGSGVIRLGNILFDRSPRGRARKVDPSITDATAGPAPDSRQLRQNTSRTLARLPLEIYRGLDELLRPKLLQQLRWPREEKAEKRPVPQAPFNADITRERSLVFASVPLDQLKALKSAFGVSLNEMVLALVSSAMRDYLLQQDSLPELSLVATVAISLRAEGEEDFGNRVTTTPVTLATDSDDPLERLQAIHRESREAIGKARKGSSKGVVDAVQHLPPLLVHAIVQSASSEQAPGMIGANLPVSNVRGNPETLYLAGAKIESMFPMSIIGHGLGINVTCVSYAGSLEFGLTLAPDLFPQPWDLADGLLDAAAEYGELAGSLRQ